MAFQTKYFYLPSHYEESPLCDRKEDLPNLCRDEKKAEFLRDTIALANSARSFGREARILFGMDNKGNPADLGEYLKPYATQASSEVHLVEKIRSQMGQAFARYITPEFSKFEFELGEYEGKRVAYLLIHPLTPTQRFHVKQDFKSGKEWLLRSGECWIRFGEHKEEVSWRPISPDDPKMPYWDSYAEIPYILPSYWLSYFDIMQVEKRIVASRKIVGYQEPVSATGEPMQAALQSFLKGSRNLLFIEGLAGIGKTAFLLRQIDRLIENNLVAMKEIERREEFRGPPDWIPLLLSLRGIRVRDCEQLAKRILDVVHKSQTFWPGRRPNHPEYLLEYSELRWLICLDGFDEIWNDQDQRNFLVALRAFLDRFPLVKVIITTRPEAVRRDETWLEADIVQMAPLSRQMVRNYVASQIREEASAEFYQEVVSVLSANDDLWRLCSFPVCLEAAMKELADIYPEPLSESTVQGRTQTESLSTFSASEDPDGASVDLQRPESVQTDELIFLSPVTLEESISDEPPESLPTPPIRPELVLHGMYSRLLDREIDRSVVRRDQAENWWDRTGKLALRLDGKHVHCDRETARRSLGSERALFWLLSLGVIDRVSAIHALAYRTEMTKTYFAAIYMQPRTNSVLDAVAHQLFQEATPDFRSRIQTILEAISTTDLSSLSM